jgi:CRP/FNR family transcriptional regulator, cyclic AMP receptor protein
MEWELFAGVPEEDLRRLLAIARRRTFDRGEVVFHRGDPADCLHLIVSGRFAVGITTPLGATALLGVRGPGDAFGELALIAPEGAQRSATVSALEPAETRSVLVGDFERLRREHPGIDGLLARLLGERVRRLSDQVTEAYYLPADKRVLRRVAELSELYGGEIPLAQEQLAELAGTSRATTNRVLRDLERRGIVELRRGMVVVRDANSLQRRGPAEVN